MKHLCEMCKMLFRKCNCVFILYYYSLEVGSAASTCRKDQTSSPKAARIEPTTSQSNTMHTESTSKHSLMSTKVISPRGSPVSHGPAVLHCNRDDHPTFLKSNEDISQTLDNNRTVRGHSPMSRNSLELRIKSEDNSSSNQDDKNIPVTPDSAPRTPSNEFPSNPVYPNLPFPGGPINQMFPWLPFYSPDKLLSMPYPWLGMWPKSFSSEMQNYARAQANYMSILSKDSIRSANTESEKDGKCQSKTVESGKDSNISKSGIDQLYGNMPQSGISLSSGSSKRKRKLPIHYKRVCHIKEDPDGQECLYQDIHHNRTKYIHRDVNLDTPNSRANCINPDSSVGNHYDMSSHLLMAGSRSRPSQGQRSEASLDDFQHIASGPEVMDLSISHPPRCTAVQGDGNKLITPSFTTTSYMPPSPGSDSESSKSVEPQPKTTICYKPTPDDIMGKPRDSRDSSDFVDSRDKARESALDLIRKIQSEVKERDRDQSLGSKFYGKVNKNELSNVPNVTIGPTNSYNLDIFRKFARPNRDAKIDTAFLPTSESALRNADGAIHNAESSAAWLQWMMASSQPQKDTQGHTSHEPKEAGSLYTESDGHLNR